jgi:hypothetical protein
MATDEEVEALKAALERLRQATAAVLLQLAQGEISEAAMNEAHTANAEYVERLRDVDPWRVPNQEQPYKPPPNSLSV